MANLTAQAGITEQATDAFTDQTTEWRTDQTAEKALRGQLLSAIATPLLNAIHNRSSGLEMKRMNSQQLLAVSPRRCAHSASPGAYGGHE
jgi:hypothetical protein